MVFEMMPLGPPPLVSPPVLPAEAARSYGGAAGEHAGRAGSNDGRAVASLAGSAR